MHMKPAVSWLFLLRMQLKSSLSMIIHLTKTA